MIARSPRRSKNYGGIPPARLAAFGCTRKTPSTFPLSDRDAFTATATRTGHCRTAVHSQANTYTVKVALDGIIYTARSSGDFWGYNPSMMIVGTELEACVEPINS